MKCPMSIFNKPCGFSTRSGASFAIHLRRRHNLVLPSLIRNFIIKGLICSFKDMPEEIEIDILKNPTSKEYT